MLANRAPQRYPRTTLNFVIDLIAFSKPKQAVYFVICTAAVESDSKRKV